MKQPQFDIEHLINFNNHKFWEMIPLLLYFMIPSMGPVVIHRMLMSSSVSQIKRSFLLSALVIFIIELSIAWIPFLLFNANPNLATSELLPYIVDNYNVIGMKSAIIIGVAAMAMSTADSYMNTTSVLFAHDICKPHNLFNKNELLTSRIFSIIMGIASIILALYITDLLDILLSTHAFYVPIVTAPLILTIMGFRTTTRPILIGMAAGLVTVITWKSAGIKLDVIVFAMIVNAIFLLGSHYITGQPGGWVGPKKRNFLNQAREENRRKWKRRKKWLREFSLLGAVKNFAPKDELIYAGFGIYAIIYTFVIMYATHSEMAADSTKTIMYFYQIMMVTGTMMGSFPIWPASIKKEIVVQICFC